MARLRTAALAALLIAGCSAPTATPRPTAAEVTPTPVPEPSTGPTAEPEQTPRAGQIDTEWGPIWEVIPEGFPEPPGGEPAEADTTVSAAYVVPAAALPNGRDVVNFYAARFADVGYGGTVDGPFEDGSYTAWASNGYGCDMLVSTLPRGPEETFVTVLYGALCPFSWPVE